MQKDCLLQNQQHVAFAVAENSEGNLFFACHNATQEYKNVWYLDSGCSNHMTGDKEAFIVIDPSFGSKVKLGNGEFVEVEGKGNIRVATKQGCKVIHDTLYVPKLDENLLLGNFWSMVILFNLRIKSAEFLIQKEELLLLLK